MKVLSATTQGQWLEELPPPLPGDNGQEPIHRPDPAKAEANRLLSEIFHCDNLVVLAGLGTSLGVQPLAADGRKAPTMGDLWNRVEAQTNAWAAQLGFTFANLLAWISHPADEKNIEALLSRCRLAEAFFPADQKARVSAFVALAEHEIANATNFVTPNHPLPVHEQFLRRLARRSNRKQRAKLFTTNYDRCFEEAARQSRLIVNDGFSHSVPATFEALNFNNDIVTRGSEGERQDFVPNLFHLYKARF
jgi:hypothetical protein